VIVYVHVKVIVHVIELVQDVVVIAFVHSIRQQDVHVKVKVYIHVIVKIMTLVVVNV
jgi:hypothetical protein